MKDATHVLISAIYPIERKDEVYAALPDDGVYVVEIVDERALADREFIEVTSRSIAYAFKRHYGHLERQKLAALATEALAGDGDVKDFGGRLVGILETKP